jgi:hypothetical protein
MNTPPYDPGTFAQLFGEPRGQRLWAALNTSEYVSCLETATALHQPAVKGIEEPLLRDFGADVIEDRFKQMIGHMVRQVMERNGYEVDQQKVKIDSIPFYAGTRYKRRDEWTYHVWRKSTDPRSCALTADRQGAKLPTLTGERWLYWRSFSGLLRASVMFGMRSEDQARKDIREQGYHLVTMARVMRAA